jgi:hypothetical protein
MNKKQGLSAWIKEALSDPDKDVACSSIALVHRGGGGYEREIHGVKITTEKQHKPEDLADLFHHKALGYSQELPGVQMFCLLAFYGTKEPLASHPFRISGETEYSSGGNGWATEGPTDSGLRQQNMRHTEALVQGAFRMNSQAFSILLEQSQMLSRNNVQLMEENRMAFESMKNMTASVIQEQFRAKEQELELKEKYTVFSKAMQYLPQLANSISGHKLFPDSVIDESVLETIASSLDEEKLKQLTSIFPPEVMGPLASRLQSILQAKNKEKTEAKATANRLLEHGLDPEADAAGQT